jgi:hypothetical protein
MPKCYPDRNYANQNQCGDHDTPSEIDVLSLAHLFPVQFRFRPGKHHRLKNVFIIIPKTLDSLAGSTLNFLAASTSDAPVLIMYAAA